MKQMTALQIVKNTTVAFAAIGLLCGVLYSFGGFVLDTLVTLEWITSSETPGLSYGTLLAFGALIGMPALFGTVGFFVGVCLACLYNIAQKFHSFIK